MKETRKSELKELQDYISKQFKENSVSVGFPEEVDAITEDSLIPESCSNRADLRGLTAFTIDCESCQDMDDAISIQKIDGGYILGVHIADVAAYVTPGSRLDQIAIERATSIYLPGLTVPMLPGILSQNLCSLNPCVDRNTLTVLIWLDADCNVEKYKITKSVIRSRVKGIYSEVNSILSESADDRVKSKYAEVVPSIKIMEKVAEQLFVKRVERGANVQDNSVPAVSFVNGRIIITPNKRGKSERMIEEFMIIANNLVAEYMAKNGLPTLYRAQKDSNKMAEYVMIKTHHSSLKLERYSHFTSPIRRLADTKTHQILTLHLNGVSAEDIGKRFDDESMTMVCEQATKKSRRANNITHTCYRLCYAKYFNWHRFENFNGVVSGFDKYNNPLVTLDDYNITVIGKAVINAFVGKRVVVNLFVGKTNTLYVNKEKIAA